MTTTATHPDTTAPDAALRSRLADAIAQLEKGSARRDPLAVLENWSVPEADRQGYLDGLSTASRMIYNILNEVPAVEASDVLADTAAVAEFMSTFGQTVRTVPTTDITPEERVLRARIVLEEALEFVEAMGCDVVESDGYSPVTKSSVLVEINPGKDIDLVEATDAMADLDVVVKGSAHTLGVPVDAAFQIVHGTNMAKAPGGVVLRREDGKIQKPEGWVGPTENLRALLVDSGWTG